MYMNAVRLLEYRRRLERAEELVRDLQLQLREQPDLEERRHALRIAKRETLRTRRARLRVSWHRPSTASRRNLRTPQEMIHIGNGAPEAA